MLMIMLAIVIAANDEEAAARMAESIEEAIAFFSTSPMPYIVFGAILAPFIAFIAALKIYWRRCEARQRQAGEDGDGQETREHSGTVESRRDEDAERQIEPEVGRTGTFADLCLDDECGPAAAAATSEEAAAGDAEATGRAGRTASTALCRFRRGR